MSSAPLWVPLVVAAIGVVGAAGGTIAGVAITQRRSDRREAVAWERQQTREAEAWAREDAARTFDHRRQAYSEFYKAIRGLMLAVYNHGMGLTESDEQELPWEWQYPTYALLQQLQVYGSVTVNLAAMDAYSKVWSWGNRARNGADTDQFCDDQEAADHAEETLLKAIRADLAVPDH